MTIIDSVLVAAAVLAHTPAMQPAQSSFIPPLFVAALPCAGEEAGLNEIYGVCSNSRSGAYVVDYYRGRVFGFDASGSVLAQWNSPGAHGVTVSPTGEVFVTDNNVGSIYVYTSDGVFTRRIAGSGGDPGNLYAPTYLCMTPEGTLLVSDSQNQRIQELTIDGGFVRLWGSGGTGPGQFRGPRAVAISGDGTIYVSDEANQRVQAFSRTGSFLRQWTLPYRYDETYPIPRGIAVDDLGQVYVTDRANGRIDVFQSDGTLLGMWGATGDGPNHFHGPNAVAIAANEQLFVGESDCHVQVYSRDGTTSTHPISWGALKQLYRQAQ
jgi:streptogramin lyase